jgi:selenobiotic family peptide radical SAM maturase
MKLEDIYSECRALIGREEWDGVIASCGPVIGPDAIPAVVAQMTGHRGFPPFASELACLELSAARVSDTPLPSVIYKTDLNPALAVLPLRWKNLAFFITINQETSRIKPEPVDEMLLIWKNAADGEVRCRAVTDEDLLVMKMIAEGISSREVAAEGLLSVSAVNAAIDRAIKQGILLSPRSHLRRLPVIDPIAGPYDDAFMSATSFTLQWHVTQACDLHCKHCYDRTDREQMPLDDALRILDDLHDFCLDRHVNGRISFSGGNPLLYPHFRELYRGAAERGFILSILGNPSPRQLIEDIVSIQRPDFFQVSLEGLQEHNDLIRGQGHFARTIEFLRVLRDLDIYSMVMLTLTKENMHQILPLGEILRGLTDTFNFNRLSPVGEGAQLKLPGREDYIAFLQDYVGATEENPVLGIKDNLINIIRHQDGLELFGGCTGFGCGAAFNFLSLLADGEVHACRKFPSLVGNIHDTNLAGIYDSDTAKRYRSGCNACMGCPIRQGCGGCLAIASSHGLNIFEEKDPYCFSPAD